MQETLSTARHAVKSRQMNGFKELNDAGATAIYESSPLQRYFQDIHVISQHIQSRLTNYELVGRYYLGLEVDTSRL